MTPRPIIGIAGLIGAGKSTAADHLVSVHGFRKIKFAAPLKAMMLALGLSEREVEGDLKEKPCDLLGGKTPRHAMQTLGTQWGRELICGDLWVRAWCHACAQVPEGVGVVADDVRFGNEAAAIRSLSPFALIVRVERTLRDVTHSHISEMQSIGVDQRIANNGSVEDLKAAIAALVTAH